MTAWDMAVRGWELGGESTQAEQPGSLLRLPLASIMTRMPAFAEEWVLSRWDDCDGSPLSGPGHG